MLEGKRCLACSPGQRGNWFTVALQRMLICCVEQNTVSIHIFRTGMCGGHQLWFECLIMGR